MTNTGQKKQPQIASFTNYTPNLVLNPNVYLDQTINLKIETMRGAGKNRVEKMKGDFQNKIQKKEKIMVLFSATWCPFSRSFYPIFEEYSKTNPNKCLNVISDESPEICKEYSIRYYPTVILFKNGKVQKRLDSKPGIGLSKKQLKDFTDNL